MAPIAVSAAPATALVAVSSAPCTADAAVLAAPARADVTSATGLTGVLVAGNMKKSCCIQIQTPSQLPGGNTPALLSDLATHHCCPLLVQEKPNDKEDDGGENEANNLPGALKYTVGCQPNLKRTFVFQERFRAVKTVAGSPSLYHPYHRHRLYFCASFYFA